MKFEHGTYIPHCAMVTQIPIARIKLVFPTAFVPYNKIPNGSFPNETSFGT